MKSITSPSAKQVFAVCNVSLAHHRLVNIIGCLKTSGEGLRSTGSRHELLFQLHTVALKQLEEIASEFEELSIASQQDERGPQ